MKKLILLAACCLGSYASYAGGYRVSAQGQRALAMGHTGVAVVNSAELAFFNPSGLVYLENKLNISAGVTGIISNTQYQNLSTRQSAETKDILSTPFNFYATYKINDWLSAGLAVYTPYGSRVEYENNWAGADLVNTIDLKSIYFNPVVGIKLHENLSVGGGPIFVTGSVEFNRNLFREQIPSESPANVDLQVDGVTAWGWVASATFKPSDAFTLGVSYRSKIDIEAEGGDVTFENITFPDTEFDATLPLPAELTLGFSVQATEKLLIATEFNRAYWGAYDELSIDFTNPNVPDSRNARDYKNATIWRVGAEYNLNEKFDLRAGYYFDESPVQSGRFAPETPRNDSHGFTTGLSYNINEKLAVDASFVYLYFEEIEESYVNTFRPDVPAFSGSYKSNAFLFGLGLTYKL